MLSKEQYQVYQDRVEMSDSEYEMICVPTRDLRELLSLREQLAELKALEPVAEMRTWPKNISGPNPDWFWFGKQDFPVGTQLFTAAKPAEE
ncbi:hypothetical protein NFB56_15955 [Yersinia ruckeri]|uniref:hypothetical protein n=1 Tax=Yersinia ruckeri TaxID=29486 RepID=UPI002237EC46|nr:hypothetical protein [Yersinia ruckeri]MCW6550333.1 hypothetical protein [Yersinia ruckeri]